MVLSPFSYSKVATPIRASPLHPVGKSLRSDALVSSRHAAQLRSRKNSRVHTTLWQDRENKSVHSSRDLPQMFFRAPRHCRDLEPGYVTPARNRVANVLPLSF